MEKEIVETKASAAPSFHMTARRALIVYVYNLKHLRILKRYGLIQYVSRRMKYVVLYMDADREKETREKVEKLHFVREVIPSYRAEIAMNFGEKIGNTKQIPTGRPISSPEEVPEIRLAENTHS